MTAVFDGNKLSAIEVRTEGITGGNSTLLCVEAKKRADCKHKSRILLRVMVGQSVLNIYVTETDAFQEQYIKLKKLLREQHAVLICVPSVIISAYCHTINNSRLYGLKLYCESFQLIEN